MNNLTDEQLIKLEKLKLYLRDLKSAAVAFSSGADSTFLLKTAHDVLDDKAIAVTARSGIFPKRETHEAEEFCRQENIRQIIFDPEEMKVEGFAGNPPDRCYLCKKAMFMKIKDIAESNDTCYVAEGSNTDDDGDYRPGLKAVAELGIKSPLRECGLSKADVRALSKYMGLQTWDKPSYACLSSRFVYGETITEEKLEMVDSAEQLLLDMGFLQVRVRIHDRLARIEVNPDEFTKMTEENNRKKITESFKNIGFTYTAMDLMGYRTGSMNETLENRK